MGEPAAAAVVGNALAEWRRDFHALPCLLGGSWCLAGLESKELDSCCCEVLLALPEEAADVLLTLVLLECLAVAVQLVEHASIGFALNRVAGVDQRARLGRANALYGFVGQGIKAWPCSCSEIKANDEPKHVFPLVIAVTPGGAQPIALKEESQHAECDPALSVRAAQGSLSGPPSHQLEVRFGSDDICGKLRSWKMGQLFT